MLPAKGEADVLPALYVLECFEVSLQRDRRVFHIAFVEHEGHARICSGKLCSVPTDYTIMPCVPKKLLQSHGMIRRTRRGCQADSTCGRNRQSKKNDSPSLCIPQRFIPSLTWIV